MSDDVEPVDPVELVEPPDGDGLAWPDHDTGPTPPGGIVRETRKRMAFWDRIKILVALATLWIVVFWQQLADDPILPLREAARDMFRNKWWITVVAAIELVRQLHYWISERSPRWHGFWTNRVFGGLERRTGRLSDWNRYRIGRFLRFIFILAIIAVITGAIRHEAPVIALFNLPARLWRALPLFFQLIFGALFVIIEFGALFFFLSRGGVETYFPDDIKTRFTDVWGQDAVVERVKENMLFLEDPESIERRGGYVPSGILLWGPPGTGKTLMAEAAAGETGKPYVFVDPGAFINMFMGIGIIKVKTLFRKLRKLAVRYGGVIVFFDEADSLGNRGALTPGGVFGGGGMSAAAGPWATSPSCNGLSYVSPDTTAMLMRDAMPLAGDEPPRRLINRMMPMMGGGGGGMGTLQALLTELSGLKKPRGFLNRIGRRLLGMRPKAPPKYRILVMMATNMPQALDEALLRPGRIDRIYKVGYPSKAGRIRTYEGYFAKVDNDLTPADMDKLATITPYATGATIKDLVNESLINAIRYERDVITWKDVIQAKQLKDLGPPEDVEYIERERHAVAVHEACHAVMAYRVRKHLTIDIATIEKGGTYLGMVASIPPEDQFTRWRTEYEADILVSLASLAGEKMFFEGDSSSGVSGDLETATALATFMEGFWGMGSTVSSHSVTERFKIGGAGRPGEKGKTRGKEKDLLAGSLGARIEEHLGTLLTRSQEILEENRTAVLAVAHALETHKTVTGDDVEAIIEARPGPLIDGSVYRDRDFAKQAEAYHAQVLAAHKAHAAVQVPLPVLNGRLPVEAISAHDAD